MVTVCYVYIDGLVQEFSIAIGNALELLHSCTKPLIKSALISFEYLIYLLRQWNLGKRMSATVAGK